MSKFFSSLLILVSIVLFSSGCANGYGGYGAPKKIIIDTQGVNMNAYYQDLADLSMRVGSFFRFSRVLKAVICTRKSLNSQELVCTRCVKRLYSRLSVL